MVSTRLARHLHAVNLSTLLALASAPHLTNNAHESSIFPVLALGVLSRHADRGHFVDLLLRPLLHRQRQHHVPDADETLRVGPVGVGHSPQLHFTTNASPLFELISKFFPSSATLLQRAL